MGKNILALCAACMLFFAPAAAQPGAGNGQPYDEETVDIINNLDSLMNLWYVKNTAHIRQKRYSNIYGFRPDEVPQYSDSVYAARLANIESPLPYEYNDKVKAFINLYALRKRDQVERMLGLAEFYFPIFESTFDRYGLPHEIKYLAVVESALNPVAVSSANAVGIWQFIHETGRMYKLTINSYIDERRDPYLASEAAAQYLKDAYELFGDWWLAIASYNCGAGNVNKAIRRSGGKRTFWEIYNYLPKETRGYVPAFIAASYVFQYHKEHNLFPVKSNLPIAVDTVLVDEEIAFGPIASVLDVDVEVIRDLNPQYKKDVIPARAKPYVLRLPSTKAWAFCEHRDSIYICYAKEGNNIRSNTAPANTPPVQMASNSTEAKVQTASATTTAATSEQVMVKYTVRAGESLSLIADWFDVSIYSIRRWNGIQDNNLQAGQRLSVYVPADRLEYYESINSMSAEEKHKLTGLVGGMPAAATVPSAKPSAPAKPVSAAAKPVVKYHTVQRGETLFSISKKYAGTSVNGLRQANNLRNASDIKAGQRLKIVKD